MPRACFIVRDMFMALAKSQANLEVCYACFRHWTMIGKPSVELRSEAFRVRLSANGEDQFSTFWHALDWRNLSGFTDLDVWCSEAVILDDRKALELFDGTL